MMSMPTLKFQRSITSTVASSEKADDTSTQVGSPVYGHPNQDILTQYKKYPNSSSRIREWMREPAAEFFGVMILVIFGNGVNCQTQLSMNGNVSSSAFGDFLSLNFGWAVGAAVGVWLSGGISGGHINPAVTLAMATFRDFPWRKVPAYIAAQVMGGLCGAGIVYANYIHAIDLVEGGRHLRTVAGTAGLFATYPASYMTPASAWFDEFIGTALLLIVVCVVTDARNGPTSSGLVPMAIFIAILGISAAFGMQTGFAINPARDLGPRLLTAMVGYGGEVFSFRSHYWLWCPIIAPIIGALAGTFVYDFFFYTGEDSILNRPNKETREFQQRSTHTECHPVTASVAGPDMV